MTKILLTDLATSKPYKIQLRSIEDGVPSNWSTTMEFTTSKDTNPPSAVTDLLWQSVGTSFLATWTATDTSIIDNYDFSHYEVRVTYNSANVYYTTQTNRFDFTLEANIAAFGQPRSPLSVAVRTVDFTGNTSAWASFGSVSNPAPAAPTALTATPGIERVSLEFTPPSDTDIDYYRVYTSASANGTYTLQASPRTNSYVHETTSTGMIYYRIFTVDIFGTESTSYASANAQIKVAAVTDTTAPNAPTAVSTTAGFDLARQQAYVDITWTNPTANDLDVVKIRYGQTEGTWTYVLVPAVSGTTQTYRLDVPAGTSVRTAVSAQDFSGNASAYTNSANYPVTAAADTSAPSKPANPSATGGVMSVFVSHDNTKNGGGAIESDTSYYEVHGSTSTNFSPSISTQLGVIQKGSVTSGVFNVTATKASPTWYIKVIAVDRSGNRSVASDQVSVTVAVVAAGNVDQTILDSITNAQSSADNSSKVYIQSGTPTGRSQDIWIDTGNGNVAKRWNGTAWVAIPDANIQAAATAAANAQQTANNAAGKDEFATNPTFDVWPSGQGAPTGWGTTGGNPTRETALVRTAPTAVRYNVTASGNYFVFQTVPLDNPQYVTVTFDFYLVSGDLSGSGALIRWNNTAPATFDTTVKFADEFPTATTGKWYTVTKTLKRPTNFTGTFASLQLYAMHAWTALGTVTAKDMIIDRASIRPATAMEILSYEAPTVASMNTAIANSANGKNKITYSASAASGTTGYINGDVWYQLSGGQIIGFWIYNGTIWVSQTINNTVIASLDAAKITTGTLDAQRIAAGTIDVTKLAVGDTTNYAGDGKFMYPANWPGVTIVTNTTEPNYALVPSVNGANADKYSNYWFDVNTGDTFYVSYDVFAESANTSWNGVNVGIHTQNDAAASTWVGVGRTIAQNQASAGTWVTVTGTVTITQANARRGRVWFSVQNNANAGSNYRFRNFNIRKRFTGQLIVDGAIDARTVGANEIVAQSANIKDGVIGTAKISDAAITNAKIGDAEITNAKVKSFKADKIEANSALVTDITLKDGTDPNTGVTTSGRIKSDNYDPVTRKGMQVSKSGIEVYDGFVSASTLELRSSFNILPPTMTSFESKLSYYQSAVVASNATIGISSDPVFGDQAFTITPATTNPWAVSLGVLPKTIVEAGKRYILSIYAHGTSTPGEKFMARLMYDNGAFSDQVLVSDDTKIDVNLTPTYVRYSAVITIPSDVSMALVALSGTGNTTTITVDGIQLEEKVGVLKDPSRWQPPSSTVVDGGQIKTGSLQSSDTSSGRPAWAINLAGDAQFASAKITGALTVGENQNDNSSYAQSGNYGQVDASGMVKGWKIASDGTADFNSMTMRGQANLSSARVFGNMTVIAENGKPPATMDIGSGTTATIYGKLAAPPAPNILRADPNSFNVDPVTGTKKFYGPTFDSDGNAYMVEADYSIVTESFNAADFETGPNEGTWNISNNGSYFTPSQSTEYADTGTNSLKIIRNTSANSTSNKYVALAVSSSISVAPGSVGSFSVSVKAGTTPIKVDLIDADSNQVFPGSVNLAANASARLTTPITKNFRPSIKISNQNGDSTDFATSSTVAYLDNISIVIDQKKTALRINQHNLAAGTINRGIWNSLPTTYYGVKPEDLLAGFNWVSGTGSSVAFDVVTKTAAGNYIIRRYSGSSYGYNGPSSDVQIALSLYQDKGYKPWINTTSSAYYTAWCYNADVERNEVRNPTFNTGATLWQSGYNAGSDIVWSGSTTKTLIVQSNVSSATPRGASPTLGNALCNKGDYIYASALLKPSNAKIGNFRARIVWSDGTYTYGDVQSRVDGDNYVETTVSGQAPINGAYAIEWYFGRAAGAPNWTSSEEIGRVNDAIVVNNGQRPRVRPLSYFDGNSTSSGWQWAGTADASVSYRTIPEGSLIIDRYDRSAPTTLVSRQYGNQLYADITGLVRSAGDYTSTSPESMTYAVTRRQDPDIPATVFGVTWLSYVGSSPSNATPVALTGRESGYLNAGGLGFRASTFSRYFVYNALGAKIEELPRIHSGLGTLSIALTYYSSTSFRETVMSPPVAYTYYTRNRIALSGIASPDIPPTVATADRPTGVRVYVGANGTTDRTKMQLVTTTTGFPSTVNLDDLTMVPRGGDNVILPGSTATTAPNPPPATSGFASVAGFTAAILHSANDFFSVDGNGSGRISGLSFSENGLVLQTLGGTSGQITTNTGGFRLSHDGTGTWPGLARPWVSIGVNGTASIPTGSTPNPLPAATPAVLKDSRDSAGYFSVSGDVLTVQQSGLYSLSLTGWFAANATGNRFISLVNAGGSNVIASIKPGFGTTTNTLEVSDIIYITAGTTLQMRVWQASGGNLNMPNATWDITRM